MNMTSDDRSKSKRVLAESVFASALRDMDKRTVHSDASAMSQGCDDILAAVGVGGVSTQTTMII